MIEGVVRASAIAMALALGGCALWPRTATAQYSLPECTSVLHTIVEALHQVPPSFKRLIQLERQYLT
jgi:hypothetical protein